MKNKHILEGGDIVYMGTNNDIQVLSQSEDGYNALKVNYINKNISNLLGEVLTIIDASIEGEKNKAVKDLIKDKFSDKQNWFTELSWKRTESTSVVGYEWEKELVQIEPVVTFGGTGGSININQLKTDPRDNIVLC